MKENIVGMIFAIHVVGMLLTLVCIIGLDSLTDTEILFGNNEISLFCIIIFWELSITYYLLKFIYQCIKFMFKQAISILPESERHKLKQIENNIIVEIIGRDSKYIEGFNANDKYAYYYYYNVLAKIKFKYFKKDQIGLIKNMLVKKCEEYINDSDIIKKNIINGIKFK
jgi:hypothetical protein